MLNKFYSYTLKTKFIKNLIASTNIPIVSSWKPGDFVVEGLTYISKDGILKARATGNPKYYAEIDSVTKNKFFDYISPYVFGQYYECITGQYRSNIQGYDETTHYWLGQYLRYLRDIQGIDLMPFYNCATNRYLSDINFNSNGEIIVSNNNAGYKIMSIPIKFNQKYLIGLECGTSVQITPIIYSERGYIEDVTLALQEAIKASGNSVVLTKFNTSLRSPFIYETPSFTNSTFDNFTGFGELMTNGADKVRKLMQYEKYLRLLIKMPTSCNTSIVVLEGDYVLGNGVSHAYSNISILNDYATVNQETPGMQNRCIAGNSEHYKNKELLSPLSLLQINDGVTYAFSDRLIEYLLLNAITPIDEIGEDIQRIQEYASSVINLKYNGKSDGVGLFSGYSHLGLWNDNLRVYLYKLMMQNKSGTNALDLCGYADKDTEQLVMRGQQLICRDDSKW